MWKISGKKCEKKFIENNGEEMRKQSVRKMWKTKEWKECEKFWEKNVEKNWRWKNVDKWLGEVKSVEKCQCGKKRDKFPWKNITYLVVSGLVKWSYVGICDLGTTCGSTCFRLFNITSCLRYCFLFQTSFGSWVPPLKTWDASFVCVTKVNEFPSSHNLLFYRLVEKSAWFFSWWFWSHFFLICRVCNVVHLKCNVVHLGG